MTCNEIENRLPAYLEGLLSPEEGKSIAGHLASCHRCSRAFTDLKKAEKLVQGLGEVEPPPFFEQRIMSRIREEAGRRQGILRRLFYPLHIKIPTQALATLLVAVLAFYVYQKGEPEMKQMAPLPVPMTELGKGRVTAESLKVLEAPSAVAPAKQTPVGDLPEVNPQRLAAPPFENAKKEVRTADSPAPMREEHPAAMRPTAPAPDMAARKEEVPRIGTETLGKAPIRTGKQDAEKALETLPPEQKQKQETAGAAAGESGKRTSAPAPPLLTSASALKRSVLDLTIQVRDPYAAIREIEERLDQFNTRIIERQHREEGEFLKAEIAAQNVAALLDRLREIGSVNLETNPFTVSDGNVTVGIKIVSYP